MSEEDQELLAQISYLAGQINRHKNSLLESSSGSGVHRHHHYSLGRARGGYGRGYGYRNHTLVFNHGEGETKQASDESNGDSSGAWVSKHGRHLQLINTAAYDRDAARSRSGSRPVEGSSREDQETNRPAQPRTPAATAASHQLEVEGIIFQVTDGGRRLVRTTGSDTTHRKGWKLTKEIDSDPSRPTPETATISNIQFYRSKDGSLERADAPRGRWVKLPLQHPLLTQPSTKPMKTGLCKRFSNTGQCPRGPRCPHVHDPNKVAVCRDFLRSGKCPNGAHCDLSHECSYERVPACSHFQRGQCTKDDCRYAHIHVNPAAAVCRAFSTYGYCEKGSLCQDRHVFECPDYASTGQCLNKACRLPHIDRAGKLRQSTGENNGPLVGSGSQSDTPEEEDMIPLGGNEDGVLSQQDDFIQFS